ncbi:hypothetical protein NL676_025793 [Syzygium grande]|nr:hypothetical protein NL676_025793 [Syzygium grande]
MSDQTRRKAEFEPWEKESRGGEKCAKKKSAPPPAEITRTEGEEDELLLLLLLAEDECRSIDFARVQSLKKKKKKTAGCRSMGSLLVLSEPRSSKWRES